LEGLDQKESIQIKLTNFEGPLDLLLYLIRKDEIDIYDIPIAEITRQYLETIELMRELDLEVAGEFILMAATLIQIKVRMLLPSSPDEVTEEEEDPRAELVRQLLEYKRYKEVSESLIDMESRQRRLFPRTSFGWVKKISTHRDEISAEELLKDVTMFDLVMAFKTVLDNLPKITDHHVESIGVTIEEQIDYIVNRLGKKERWRFSEFMSEIKERVTVIVTFLAILELIRTHHILVQQATVFGEIWVSRRSI
jgi:segregation and condensation protein A